MGYSEYFQSLRESKGLTREQLAARAKCHRNTVINVETGRPVRFGTLIPLMERLGFRKQSPEMRMLAVKWLESVTGIEISRRVSQLRPVNAAARFDQIDGVILAPLQRGLPAADIELLHFAATNRRALNAVRVVRDEVQKGAPSRTT